MKEIKIGPNENEKRLDSFLKSYLPNAGGSFIYKMLRKKNITLNDKRAEGKEKLKTGDSIKIFFSDETFYKFRGTEKKVKAISSFKALDKFGDLEIVFENSDVLFVNKPAEILSQKANSTDLSLNDWLVEYLLKKGDITPESLETYKPSICNRLDRNTSGLVICAKSLKGARCMNQMLKERTLDKYYITIVIGKIDHPSELKGYLYKDENKNKVFIKQQDPHDDRYSFIETYYKPLGYNAEKNMTLLEVKLVTGKPHQIRAHLSSCGTPIIGDVKYCGPKIDKLNYQLLHSYRLEFPDNMPEGFDDIAGRKFIATLPDIFNKFF